MIRKAAACLASAVLAVSCAAAEDAVSLPPSPEPPEERVSRPTAAPTAVPDAEIIDHVNHPDILPTFTFAPDAKLLHIWFPNIKDADEAILVFEDQVFLIDCGDERSGASGAALLRQIGVSRIDILFNSHPHHDHINGLAGTDDAAHVGSIRICFPAESTESGQRMVRTAGKRNIPIMEFRNGDVYQMGSEGEVTLTFLQNTDTGLDMNNRSAQTMVRYGERSILFTADMEAAGQEALLKIVNPANLRCDIVKYPHHGKSAMSEEFYAALGCRLAVVTSIAGRDDEGQRWLGLVGLPAVFTYSKTAYIHLVTDGKYWLCETVPIQ